ncbi:MAG: hypothetical protein ACK5C8_05460 [Roseiflexaceae bacterium]|jgi:hypothetical protein|nr:hypothetical protein [Chloroflexaceae bacterium]
MLPSPNIVTQTPAQARQTIATAIDVYLSGAVTINQLAQWALQAYHARVTDLDDAADDEHDDDAYVFDEETLPAGEQMIVEVLDALMFADEDSFMLDADTLATWRNRLRIAVV